MIGGTLGVVTGSFLATAVIRWPSNASIVSGRSRCDSCGRQLAATELVPLVSWLSLRGRCRTCAAPIPWLHPLVELGCGAAGAWFFALGAPLLAPLVWLLLTIAILDARHYWLPDRLVAPIALAALVCPPLDPDTSHLMRIGSGLAAFAALWLVARLFRLATGREGMGGGDPKLFAAIALWTGPMLLPALLLGSSLLGLAHAALQHLCRAGQRQHLFPFGTYLSVTAILFALAASW